MKNIYADLKTGFSSAEALQRAKLRMLRGRQEVWRHPRFWSPFVVLQ